jgi:hypothetical protein
MKARKIKNRNRPIYALLVQKGLPELEQIIVKFHGLTSGTIVESKRNDGFVKGFFHPEWFPHTMKEIWQYLPDYEEKA